MIAFRSLLTNSRRVSKTITKHVTILQIRFSSKDSYFHHACSEPLKYMTVGQLLDEACVKWPDRMVVSSVHEDLHLTFKDLKQKGEELASGLLLLGLKPGDRLGMLAPSNTAWLTTFIAAAKTGLIMVNINPAFKKDELKYCLEKAEINALISDEKYLTQNYYSMMCSIIPELESTPHASNLKETNKQFPFFKTLILNTNNRLPGCWRLEDVMTDVTKDLKNIEQDVQPDDPCNIQFSSGTTGRPKAALLNHFTLINNAYFFGKTNGFGKKHHTLCLQVPLFHTFGLSLGVIGALNYGISLVIPAPRFSPETTIESLKKNKFSLIYGTPTMYVDLCNKIQEVLADDKQLQDSLKNFSTIVSGGAVCSPQLFKLMSETFNCTNLSSAYGMTECSPITMKNTEFDTFEQRTTTVGFVAEHTEVKVVDDRDKVVKFGEVGEAWFRTYATMLGYYGEPEKTRDAITPCRWIKTGDLFILHENGYGQVVGRKKDLIIRGGENIFPIEIEEFLESHPEIQQAQIYGVPEERMGEEVCASIQIKPDSKLTQECVRQYCKQNISHFKIPKYIKFVDDFPKTASGKIQKFILREQMAKELKKSES